MSYKRILKTLVPPALKSKIKNSLGVPSQEKSFRKLKQLGFEVQVVLDIGAYEGNWAKDFKKIYPSANILMIEGQTTKEKFLVDLSRKISGLDYKIALLGAYEQPVDFNVYETASSILKEHHSTEAIVEQRTLSCLDKLLENTNYSKPDLIKIDTQGYELEILKGGEKILSGAKAVLLEVSLIDIYQEVPLVADVIEFMRNRNFVLFDICSFIYRPLDQVLYQSDFLFVKKELFLRENKNWS
ncbi:FkbM family methyltransferase [Flavihumibacter sp. R14]|nr:FkbM family methyltransferase [Flavihumibacter soli]